MWPFQPKHPPEVELTNETYSRWLRAQRPPWDWYLRQPSLIQEQLAILGDEYVFGVAETVAEDQKPTQEQEVDAVRKIASELIQKQLGRQAPQTPVRDIPPTPPLSMGGVTKRRQERQQADQKERDMSRMFLGRRPDSVRTGYEGSKPLEEGTPGYDGMGGLPEPGDGGDTG